MRKSRFGEEQIIGIPKEHQAEMTAADPCRKHDISDAALYTWRSKSGGMEVAAGRVHFRTPHCAVVSNTGFAPSARSLAAATSVRLLHHEDLDRLAEVVRSPAPTRDATAGNPPARRFGGATASETVGFPGSHIGDTRSPLVAQKEKGPGSSLTPEPFFLFRTNFLRSWCGRMDSNHHPSRD